MPLVSVLLPVRNGALYLQQAVDSILGQTLSDLELIVVDDGSVDKTPEILADTAKRDQRLVCVTQPPSGLVAALEAARHVAKSPYIARMDADDVATKDRLSLQVCYLDEHPEVVALGGQAHIIDEHGRRLGPQRYPRHPDKCRAHLAFGSPFCHPAVMLRAAALRQCGGYRDIYRYAEDFDLWLRLAKLGELANLKDVVLHYRQHKLSMTALKPGPYAAAAALFSVEASFGISAASTVKRNMDDWEGWLPIEEELPPEVKTFARTAYLRALSLNGGIVGDTETALLLESVGELVVDAKERGKEDLLAFALVRAAYQLVRSKKMGAAMRLITSAMLRMPLANINETVRVVRTRIRS